MRTFTKLKIEEFNEETDLNIKGRNIIACGQCSWAMEFPQLDYGLLDENEEMGFLHVYENGCIVIFLYLNSEKPENPHAVLFLR